MPERLVVHLNREEPRDVAPEAAVLETDRSFVLEFVNHGGPIHVHLHLDDALAAVANAATTQVYVAEDERRGVEISIPPDHPPARGFVDLVTGYGAEKARVNVTVEDQRKDGGPDVAVDESLAEKPEVEVEPSTSLSDAARPVMAATGVVVLAVAVAVVLSDSLAVLVGVLALLAAVIVAAYVMLE